MGSGMGRACNLRRRSRGRPAELAILLLFGCSFLSRSGGGLGSLFPGQALGLGSVIGSLAGGFLLGLAVLVCPALFLFGLGLLGAFLAAAGVFKRGHARFLGLAQ